MTSERSEVLEQLSSFYVMGMLSHERYLILCNVLFNYPDGIERIKKAVISLEALVPQWIKHVNAIEAEERLHATFKGWE